MANMYMVSCRREFWSANDFSTADEIRHLDLTGNGQDDALVGFAWPGGASGVSFPFARGRAEDAARRRACASSWPLFKDPVRSSTSTHTPSVHT